MIEVKVGSTLKDLDTRNHGRTVVVIAVSTKYATYRAGKRTARVRLDRIYGPLTTKKSGYALVS